MTEAYKLFISFLDLLKAIKIKLSYKRLKPLMAKVFRENLICKFLLIDYQNIVVCPGNYVANTPILSHF